MSFAINQFLVLRPYLYHLTFPENLIRIQKTLILEPTNSLLAKAGQSALGRERRRVHRTIEIENQSTRLRDQYPLHKGNVRLPEDWSYEDLLHYINDHVFFWPGSAAGPIPYGLRHFQRYESEKPVILRVSTAELLLGNADSEALFCKYNSGAPRCSHGNKSPRGPNTFANAANFGHPARNVIEVTFRSFVRLPLSAHAARSPAGHWCPLESFIV